MNIEFTHTVIPDTPCPQCKAYSFALSPENLRKYFYSEDIVCEKCAKKLDWWTSLLRHLEWNYPPFLYGLVGALNTLLVIIMKPNEIFDLDLVEAGVPKDAKILNIGYTPNEKGLFPVELHGNSPIRHFIPHKISLFGRPFGEPTSETRVAISITWIPMDSTDESWQNLIQAAEAYSIEKYSSFIIPANVAVEAKLNEVMRGHLSKFASTDRVDDFLETRATYSYQLNVLLPMLTSYIKFPSIPDHIRGSLNTLREFRNDIAHRGSIERVLDRQTSARMLCAAIFGLGYVNLLEKELNRAA
jgi:hypothetical protein